MQLGTIEAIEGQREDQSIHFVLRLAQTEVVAIVGFTCIARAQKPLHASGSTGDRLFATVNIGRRSQSVRNCGTLSTEAVTVCTTLVSKIVRGGFLPSTDRLRVFTNACMRYILQII